MYSLISIFLQLWSGRAFQVAFFPVVKNLSATQEMQIWSPGWEHPLEKEMAAHSSIPAWEIPWTEESGGLQSMESQKSQKWLSD